MRDAELVSRRLGDVIVGSHRNSNGLNDTTTKRASRIAGNEPARLAQLDDGNDRAILVQGDEGPAQVVRLGHRGTPSVHAATKLPRPRRPPHSISWSHPNRCGYGRGARTNAEPSYPPAFSHRQH